MNNERSGARLVAGSVWVFVLVALAAVITHHAVTDCLERGNWCDAIEQGEGN